MMSETLIPFDENLVRLPSCLSLHAQLRPNLNRLAPDEYIHQLNDSHISGIIRKTESGTEVLALAVYRTFLVVKETIRFEIDDFIVDEKERNRGLGTKLFNYLLQQAKQSNILQISVHCDLANTNAQRFFFRLGLSIVAFEFYLNNYPLLESNNQIQVIDITDIENDEHLSSAYNVFRQLRPNLPTDEKAYINKIRSVCRTGSARMIVAMKIDDEKMEILGLAVYRVASNTKYSTHLYCDDLVTNENKRSLGVGRCLINYMKNEGKKSGIHQLILDSGCQRTRAHKFYHREGFTISRFGFMIYC